MTAIVKDKEFAHADHGDAGKTPLGFWIYLMSD